MIPRSDSPASAAAVARQQVALTRLANGGTANPLQNILKDYMPLGTANGVEWYLVNGLVQVEESVRQAMDWFNKNELWDKLRNAWQVKDLPHNNPPRVLILPLSDNQDGSGGAFHISCQSATWFVDVCQNQPKGYPISSMAERCCALVIAEASESMMAAQASPRNAWTCNYSHGEGLSRVWADTLCPGVLPDYASPWAWLNPPADLGGPKFRANWVDQTEATDQDYESIGCSVLFVNWLRTVLGYNLGQISYAAASTLAGVYANLTGKPESQAWPAFSREAELKWVPYPNGTTKYENVPDNGWA